eukprot:s1771_g10.t1
MDKQSCGQTYRETLHTMGIVKRSGVKEKWLTQEEAIAKYGKNELAERVTSTGEEKTKKETMLDFNNMSLENLHDSDFEVGANDEDSDENNALPQDLAKVLGVKNGKDKKDDKDKEKESKANTWELESKISAGTSAKDLQEKLVKFKSEITKDVANLEMKAMEIKKFCPHAALQRQIGKACANGTAEASKLQKLLKEKRPKMESAKNQLKDALTVLTELKALKGQVARHQKSAK